MNIFCHSDLYYKIWQYNVATVTVDHIIFENISVKQVPKAWTRDQRRLTCILAFYIQVLIYNIRIAIYEE